MGRRAPVKKQTRAALHCDAHHSTPRVASDKAPEERVEMGADNVRVAMRVLVPAILDGGVHSSRPHGTARNSVARKRKPFLCPHIHMTLLSKWISNSVLAPSRTFSGVGRALSSGAVSAGAVLM